MSVQYHVLRDVCGTEMAFPNPTRQWRTGAGECGGGVQTPPPRNSRVAVAHLGILFRVGEGVQQIQLRTEDRENGVLGAVAP